MRVTSNISSKPLIIKSLPSKIGGGIDNIFTIASSPVRLRGKKSGFEKRTEYVDTLEKFRYGEKVAGTIAGFSLSLAGNVQYAFVDLAAAMESQKEETKGKLLCIERLKLTRGLTPCDIPHIIN